MSASCGYAIWKGGLPERLTGIVLLLAYIVTLLVQDRVSYFEPQWGWIVVDSSLGALLIALAIWNNRNWLLFGAALQVLAIMTHLAILADAGVRTIVYYRGLFVWNYLLLVALVVGTWLESRQRQMDLYAGTEAGATRR